MNKLIFIVFPIFMGAVLFSGCTGDVSEDELYEYQLDCVIEKQSVIDGDTHLWVKYLYSEKTEKIVFSGEQNISSNKPVRIFYKAEELGYGNLYQDNPAILIKYEYLEWR